MDPEILYKKNRLSIFFHYLSTTMKTRKRKRVSRRNSSKRRKLSPTLRKTVKSIVSRASETKLLQNVNGKTVVSHLPYSHNILYGMTQGSADGYRIGNKINLISWTMRGNFSNSGGTSLSKPFWIYLFFMRHPTYRAANVSFGTVGSTDHASFFNTPYSQLDAAEMLVPNTKNGVQCLSRKKIFVRTQPLSTANSGRSFVWHVNLKNKPFEYEESLSGYQTKWNYYVIIKAHTCTTTLAGSDTTGYLEYITRLHYKDS